MRGVAVFINLILLLVVVNGYDISDNTMTLDFEVETAYLVVKTHSGDDFQSKLDSEENCSVQQDVVDDTTAKIESGGDNCVVSRTVTIPENISLRGISVKGKKVTMVIEGINVDAVVFDVTEGQLDLEGKGGERRITTVARQGPKSLTVVDGYDIDAFTDNGSDVALDFKSGTMKVVSMNSAKINLRSSSPSTIGVLTLAGSDVRASVDQLGGIGTLPAAGSFACSTHAADLYVKYSPDFATETPNRPVQATVTGNAGKMTINVPTGTKVYSQGTVTPEFSGGIVEEQQHKADLLVNYGLPSGIKVGSSGKSEVDFGDEDFDVGSLEEIVGDSSATAHRISTLTVMIGFALWAWM